MPDGSFDYWYGGRPVVQLATDTGQFDYWYGGRPVATAAAEEEPPPDPPSTDTLVFGLGAMR